jgi:tetrahydromethanopterin S-methyltransferase subunit G
MVSSVVSQETEFEALSKELAEKELELATLENELTIFEKRYTRTVGILFAELDILEREIAKELLRLHPDEKYQQNFHKAERKAQDSQDAVNEKTRQEEKPAYIPTEEIKNLFRKVAKAVHPDLAITEKERAFRTELMARANAAYKTGDKQALEQILYEWEHRDENYLSQVEQPKEFEHLKQKITQIKRRIMEIEAQIRELKTSDLYQLLLKVKQTELDGHDLLNDMANDLQNQIHEAKKLLDGLKQQERG